MKYDVYFHNDFDGRASAAVFLDFLEKQGDTIQNYFAADHFIRPKWDKLVRTSKNPVAIFDFYFHPKAAFFFDHHLTTFINSKWEKDFNPSKFFYLKYKYESCCRLVFDSLRKNFGYKPSAAIKELVFWADVIDAAKFKSAKDLVEFRNPAAQIDAYIDHEARSGDPLIWLIQGMGKFGLAKLARGAKVAKVVKIVKSETKKGLDFYRKHLQVYDKVCFIDLSAAKVERVRFAPHYLVPKLSYVITLTKIAGGFRIAVGGNPWTKKPGKYDLRKLVRERYGFRAGGHKRAAGITGIKTKNEAEKIVKELIGILNK